MTKLGKEDIRLGAIYKFGVQHCLKQNEVAALLMLRAGFSQSRADQLAFHWFASEPYRRSTAQQTGYYVTVRRDGKTGWLFGPIADHDLAKSFVEPVRALACRIDPWCDFDAFGTSSITTTNTLPQGKLNDRWQS